MPPTSRPKFVTTVHGFYSVNPYSAIMTKGESVICVSSSVQDYVLQNYPKAPRQKLRVIHRGVDPAAYPTDYQPSEEWLAQWRKEFPKTKDKFVITLPGRITRWKGSLDFLQVIAALKENGLPVHGLLVGEAHPRKQGFYQALYAEIYKSGLEKDISLVGHRSDLREIMAISDAVVSCSTDPEAFGRVTLEALTLGKPVAGYDHGGVREQLDALLLGKIPIGNTTAMAERLANWHTPIPKIHCRTRPSPSKRCSSKPAIPTGNYLIIPMPVQPSRSPMSSVLLFWALKVDRGLLVSGKLGIFG